MTHRDLFDLLPDAVKHAVDLLSIGVVIGTLADVLPSIASAMTIIWMGIRVYESKTFGRLVGRKQEEITPADSD